MHVCFGSVCDSSSWYSKNERSMPNFSCPRSMMVAVGIGNHKVSPGLVCGVSGQLFFISFRIH